MMPDNDTLDKWEQFDKDVAKHSYLKRIGLIITQVINVVFLNGSQDQTTSGHIARKQYDGTARWYHNVICNILRKIEKSHCWLSRKE